MPTHSPVFFNATPTAKIYTLSLHDALPIYTLATVETHWHAAETAKVVQFIARELPRLSDAISVSYFAHSKVDRKSTRLNSSHRCISYAVFCLKKKKHRQHVMIDEQGPRSPA